MTASFIGEGKVSVQNENGEWVEIGEIVINDQTSTDKDICISGNIPGVLVTDWGKEFHRLCKAIIDDADRVPDSIGHYIPPIEAPDNTKKRRNLRLTEGIHSQDRPDGWYNQFNRNLIGKRR